MKRTVLCLIAAILAAAFVLGGAGLARVARAQDPIELTFWNYWDGKNGETIQALVDRYNAEHPDVQIENVFVGWDELLPKLQLAVTGGDTPDLAAADMVWMPYLGNSGALVPLDSFIEASGTDLEDFFPAFLALDIYGTQLYILPDTTNTYELICTSDPLE